jgi:DNA polymerase-3 subunit gamma/tau
VVFILCTTDAQKIPLTVIGRCQQFVFRRHSEEQITSRLTHIAVAEKVEVDAEAMQLIARTAQGSMRDAVGLLDQLVPLASGPITLDSARSLLGIADPRLLDSLLDHVLEGRAAEALGELNRVYSEGAELRQVVRGLMEGCRDRLLAALSRHDEATARRLSAVLDSLLHLDGEVRRHAEPRFLVEATLARLAVEVGVVEGPAPAAIPVPVFPPASATAGVPAPQARERTRLRVPGGDAR